MFHGTGRASLLLPCIALAAGCTSSSPASDENSSTSSDASTSTVTGETGTSDTGDLDPEPWPEDADRDWVLWEPIEDDSKSHSAVAATSDGGAILVGFSSPQADPATQNYSMRRFDENGTLVWERTNPYDTFTSFEAVIEDSDGTFLVAGSQEPTSGPPSQPWLARFDADGNELWSKPSDPAAPPWVVGGIAIDPNERSFYVAADVTDSNLKDAMLRKYDVDGTLLWTHLVNGEASNSVDFFYGVSVAPNGDVLVAGDLHSYVVNGGREFLVQRLDSAGNVLWQYTHNGLEGEDSFDSARGVATDESGSAFVVGTSRVGLPRQADVFYARLNSDGTQAWTQLADGGAGVDCGANCDVGWAISRMSDWNLVLCGYQSTGPQYLNAWTMVFDPGGQELWSRTIDLGRDDAAFDCVAGFDGSIFVIGSAGSETLSGPFLAKYTPQY